MVVERDSSAWINASRMSGKSYLFVEGVSDECFWKKFINSEVFQIQQVNGWENVVNCVHKFNEAKLNSFCLGIVDSDFERIYTLKNITDDNICMTDFHDLEMMLYLSKAWDSALMAIDKKNKNTFPAKDFLIGAFEITDRIGYLKLASLKHNLGLIFKKENKDHEFELPKYEKVMNKDSSYLGDESLINYILSFSKTAKKNLSSIAKIDDIKKNFKKECEISYDSCQLSNGHDVTYIMPYILRKKLGLKVNSISSETIEIALLAAYDMKMLKVTQLYTAIYDWAKSNNKNIFKNP